MGGGLAISKRRGEESRDLLCPPRAQSSGTSGDSAHRGARSGPGVRAEVGLALCAARSGASSLVPGPDALRCRGCCAPPWPLVKKKSQSTGGGARGALAHSTESTEREVALLFPKGKSVRGPGGAPGGAPGEAPGEAPRGAPGGSPVVPRCGLPGPALQKVRLHLCSASPVGGDGWLQICHLRNTRYCSGKNDTQVQGKHSEMPEEMRERQEKRSTRLIPGVGFLGGHVVEDAAWMCDPASFVLLHRTAFDGGTSRHPPPPPCGTAPSSPKLKSLDVIFDPKTVS